MPLTMLMKTILRFYALLNMGMKTKPTRLGGVTISQQADIQ